MNVSAAPTKWIALQAVLLLTLQGSLGCAHIRLPAIDPSGERVFLPHSQSTTLEHGAPKPAFPAPPKPTPCPASDLGLSAPVTFAPSASPPSAVPCGTGAAGSAADPVSAGRNQLKLTPARMVAPVGTEVVLVTGYCGEDGHFLTRQPVEWIMTQDSVGHFVEVGNFGCDCIHRWRNETARKVTAHYALGWTSNQADLVTRGTATPGDDVRVAKGQTWISVTSPTEGTSHVTVWAPKATGWDRRRQTATIHWLDAQWQFPGLAVAKQGEAHVLVTTVTRNSTNAPIASWLVRYQIIEGAGVRFANGEAEIEVPTNSQGQASAEMLPQNANPGTARVAVEIVRPESASGDAPRLVIARGETLVTWSATGLAIQVAGPESIPLNATAPFRIIVQNLGDTPARDVVVSDVLPPNLKFVGSSPQGQLFGDHIEWRLGDLAGRAARTIEVQLQAQRPGDVRYCVRARSAEGLSAEGCHERARVFAPALLLNMTGPKLVDVGGEAQFQIELTNQSNVPLTNVQIVDRYDAGLTEASGKQGPLVWPLGSLGPGETQRVAITFVARQPGQLCHTVEATADGGHVATTRGCVTANAPAAGAAPAASPLRLQFAATPQQQVGGNVNYQITVTNSGAAPLTNIRVVFQYKPTLQPTRAERDFQAGRGQLAWIIPQLLRDERRTFGVECRALEADPQATARVTATADQVAAQSMDSQTEITAAGAPGATPPESPENAADEAAAPATGELEISVAATNNPVQVGQAVRFVIIVTNRRNVSDRNVAVSFRLPEGYDVTKVRASGPTEALPPDADGRVIRWRPVAELRPGEALRPYHVDLTTQPPGGQITVRAEAQSWRTPNGVSADADTTVSAR